MSEFPLAGMRILLMEDEALIAMDVEQLCRDCGAEEVVTVRSLGHLASGVPNPSQFHAAIVDIMLGGNPTTEFAHTLVQQNVPFIFATGYTDRERLFSEFPQVPVVGKPYLGSELIDAIVKVTQSATLVSGVASGGGV